MAERLADETLAQILDQVLAVDDDDFSSCADRSPFGNRHWSSANTLFVCKRWMRVGTPALYHTVVLRSNAQAQSLMRALKKTQLGGYIRKLRLEGWFGTSLVKIFKASTNMTDICFQTVFSAKDNVEPFCSAIGSVSASRIIIWKSGHSYTVQGERVRKAIRDWSPSTTKPIRLVVPNDLLANVHHWDTFKVTTHIAHLTVHVPLYGQPWGFGFPHSLENVLPQKHFQLLFLDYIAKAANAVEDTEKTVIERIQNTISAQNLLRYEHKIRIRFRPCPSVASWASVSEQQSRLIMSSSDVALLDYDGVRSSPMDGQPRALRVAIWATIFRHAVKSLHFGRNRHLLSYSTVCQVLKAAGSLVISEHLHLYSDTTGNHAIHSEIPVNYVLSATNRHPATGGASFYTSPWRDFSATFFSRFSAFNFLHSVQLHVFPCRQLPDLASALGPTVNRLELSLISILDSNSDPSTNSLQTLRFASLKQLTVVCGDYMDQFSWDLPQLKRLNAKNITDGCTRSFTRSILPQMSRLSWDQACPNSLSTALASMLAVHGAKFQTMVIHFDFAELALNSCPNLVTLAFRPLENVQSLGKMAPAMPHLALRKVILPIRVSGMPHRPQDSMKSRRSVWDDLLESLLGRVNYFPVLGHIVMGDYIWPVEASQIKDSIEVIVAEELMDHGFTVVDCEGDSWRPRLRTGNSTSGRKRRVVRHNTLET